MKTNSRNSIEKYGEAVTAENEKLLRDRIHWVCKAVRGSSVLDIGSGKGDTSILLAREGFAVTGIESDQNEWDFANRELGKENEDVKQRLHFLHGNAITYEFENKSFDTLIVGHIIDQLTHPEKLIKKSWELLNDNGTVIITTPFGLQNSVEQKSTYYLTSLVQELHPYYEIEELTIVGKSLCVIGSRREEVIFEQLQTIPRNWTEIIEGAFFQLEKAFLDELGEQASDVSFIKKELESLKEEITKTNEKLKDPFIGGNGLFMQQQMMGQLEQDKKIKAELHQYKAREEQLRREFVNYENVLMKAIQQREKNLRFLRNRLTIVEQSTKYRIGSMIHSSLKNPLRFPKELYKIARTTAGSFKRKLKGQKKRYKLVDLPYSLGPVPRSPFSRGGGNTVSYTTNNEDLNDLLIMGRYDTPSKVKDLRVASILDDFSYQSFKNDCHLITFRPDNWLEILTKELPQILFVESAWRGNSGSWQYKIAKYNTPQGEELDNLLEWCKQNNIPTVFWNKEDPIHFEKFIDTAKKFDYIYTTDENCIPDYQREAGHDRVFALPFAAQPAIHNPIKVKDYKEKNVCFAGSYYANRHEERRKDQEELLDATKEYGLEIYDRNYNQIGKEDLQFPERFHNNINGSLPYSELVRAYKQYKVFLNVNSVQNSGTMFSRRVFELMGCGTTVLSTYAKGIKEMFSDLVPMAHDDTSVDELINKIMTDESWREENELKGMRVIFNEHTYAHRLYEIGKNAGFELEKPYEGKVQVLAVSYSNDELELLIKQFQQQSYGNKKLTIVSLAESTPFLANQDIEIISLDNLEEIDKAFEEITVEASYITVFGKDHLYGEHYLSDLMQGFIFANSDVVGKSAFYNNKENQLELINGENEYTYTSTLANDAFILRKDVLSHYGIKPSELFENDFTLKEYSSFGLRMFASNRYNFIYNGASIKDNEKEDLLTGAIK